MSSETDHYISSVPLAYPKLFRQRATSDTFQLYGDRSDPSYRDVDPADGIDDRRNQIFTDLAVRFAPYMVLNTTSVPMDFKRFEEQSASFPLRIDTWDLSGHGEVVRKELIDLKNIGNEDCGEPANTKSMSVSGHLSDDCRLQQLLLEFDPENPQTEHVTKLARNRYNPTLKVLYIDYPGFDESTWLKEYEDSVTKNLKGRYLSYPKVYAHPFILEKKLADGNPAYEFVMQFWLYYPFNDGGNNHEGDWEHINVVIAPKDQVAGFQDAATIQRLIDGAFTSKRSVPDELVIKRVEYYFHHYVLPLTYATPNVYAPREVWKAEMARLPKEQLGLDKHWTQVRRRAYWDDGESVVNTHPIVFVGADNKGWDQFLAGPGGKNRDSHGSYPFPGLFRSIGPAGASEQIKATFDHRDYYKKNGGLSVIPEELSFESVYPFDHPGLVEILPDWERITDLIKTDPAVRKNWYWMTLPIYFGYPRAESPFSTIVNHVDLGNLAVHGPAYNSGWNASGPTSSYDTYLPHAFPSLFPLGFQDNISNNLGWLNAPAMLLQLPPFDVILGLVGAPFRMALGDQHPVYFATEYIPDNFVTVSAGLSAQSIPNDFATLMVNDEQLDETVGLLLAHVLINGADSTTEITSTSKNQFETGTGAFAQIAFNVGKKLITENVVRHVRTTMKNTATFSSGVPPMSFNAELNLWEYTGSLRYNFKTGGFRPYGRAGYGLSWYRMENASATVYIPDEGEVVIPYQNADTDWQNAKWTWSAGLGVEVFVLRSQSKLPGGIDLSLKLETGWFRHDLGVRTENLPLEKLVDLGFTAADLPRKQTVVRRETAFSLMLGF